MLEPDVVIVGGGLAGCRAALEIKRLAPHTKVAIAVKDLATSSNSRRNLIMRYAIVIEKGETSYGAYVPDLPGCFAVGESLEDVKELISEALLFHLEGLQEEGMTIPE